jgi:hypothetical protein
MSCSKDENGNSNYKIDPDNFFTASFGGKTYKTNGIIAPQNSNFDYSTVKRALNLTISTQNLGGSNINTYLTIAIKGSYANTNWMQNYNFPAQNLDAVIYLSKQGDALGTYSFANLSQHYITDLTQGARKYDLYYIGSANVTKADNIYIEGTYSAQIMDGGIKMPVTGSFKIKK